MNAMKLKFAIPLFVALAYGPAQGLAQSSILGTQLGSFAVLGASTVTNVPTSTISGNVGVSAGDQLPGFNFVSGVATADPQVTGSVHSNTGLAALGQSQLTTARTNLSSLGTGGTLGVNLAGRTLTPGVYTVPAGTTNLNGTLTLDGGGNANAVWVFQMPSTLITSSGSTVNVVNTGAGAGVFWNVGSSATLGSSTTFQGNILALTSITLNSTAKIGCGRALADTGAVTMNNNTIGTGCGLGTGGQGNGGLGGGGLSGGLAVGGGGVTLIGGGKVPIGNVPEPETYAITLAGLALLGFLRRRKKGAAA